MERCHQDRYSSAETLESAKKVLQFAETVTKWQGWNPELVARWKTITRVQLVAAKMKLLGE